MLNNHTSSNNSNLIKCWDGELNYSPNQPSAREDDQFKLLKILKEQNNFINCTRDILQVLLYWITYGKYMSDLPHSKLALKSLAEYFQFDQLIVEMDLSGFEALDSLSTISQKSQTSSTRSKQLEPKKRKVKEENSVNIVEVLKEQLDETETIIEETEAPTRRLTNQEKAKLKLLNQQPTPRGKQANTKTKVQKAGQSYTTDDIKVEKSTQPHNYLERVEVIADTDAVDIKCMLGSKLVSLNKERMKECGSALFSQIAYPNEGFAVRVNSRGIPVIFEAVPEEYIKPIVDFINTGSLPSSVTSKPSSFKFGLAEIANVLSLQSIYAKIPGLFISFCTILEPEEQIVLGGAISIRNIPYLKTGSWNYCHTLSSTLNQSNNVLNLLCSNPTLVIIQTDGEKKMVDSCVPISKQRIQFRPIGTHLFLKLCMERFLPLMLRIH